MTRRIATFTLALVKARFRLLQVICLPVSGFSAIQSR
jgi:hypothetical protein